MSAGMIDRRVVIQARSDDFDSGSPGYRDAHSGASTLWTTVATVWAEVRALNGRELLAANQITEEVSYLVRIRRLAFPAITEKHRIQYTEDANQSPELVRTLNIEAVQPDRRYGWLRLQCSEGANSG